MADFKPASFVNIELNDDQNLAIQEFFESTITKTMVNVKLSNSLEGSATLHFLEALSAESKDAVLKAFWIGYNMAAIEKG